MGNLLRQSCTNVSPMLGQKPHGQFEWPFEFRFKGMDSDVNPFEDMEPYAREFLSS